MQYKIELFSEYFEKQENDSKKTLTAVNTMKDIFIKLFKMFKKNE